MSATEQGITMVEKFEERGMRTQEAEALASEFSTEEEIVEYLVADNTLTDIPGVGNRTSDRIWSWFKENFTEKNQERMERSEAYCMEYQVDTPPEEATDLEKGKFYFSFICPRCDTENPMKGDPQEFANRPYCCINCRWVPLLEGGAIERFLEENGFSS